MNEWMTLLYYLSDGIITGAYSGDNWTMESIFRERAEAFGKVYGLATFPEDLYVANNYPKFRVNPETKAIEKLPEPIVRPKQEYPTAAI